MSLAIPYPLNELCVYRQVLHGHGIVNNMPVSHGRVIIGFFLSFFFFTTGDVNRARFRRKEEKSRRNQMAKICLLSSLVLGSQ
jgi:hypothetical protein